MSCKPPILMRGLLWRQRQFFSSASRLIFFYWDEWNLYRSLLDSLELPRDQCAAPGTYCFLACIFPGWTTNLLNLIFENCPPRFLQTQPMHELHPSRFRHLQAAFDLLYIGWIPPQGKRP